jgi:polar amino acid transport system substrate-binding protein
VPRPLVAISVVLLLAACGDDAGSDAAGDALVAEGVLTVCSDIPYAPLEFVDPEGHETGFDLDLLSEVAQRNDLELEVIDRPFDGILEDLDAGLCDVVASAMTITGERDRIVDFTDPYFDVDQSLLVRAADQASFSTLASLAGQRIGVQAETTGASYAAEHRPEGAEVVPLDDAEAMFAALDAGDVAALLQDFPVNAFRATQDSSLVVTETFPTGEQYGFAVRAGAATGALLDEALDDMRSDGRFEEIFADYFGDSA